MLIFFVLATLFIKSKNSYDKLNSEYESMFNYVQNFEDWIEKEQLNRHEYKNQLAVLRCLTSEKKVKDKIDEILEDSINVEGEVVHQLKTLPKGGIKGLMYYKSAIAQKNKIDLNGFTLIPLKVYFVKGHAKILLGLARGKKTYDKRETIKKRDVEREIRKEFKEKNY